MLWEEKEGSARGSAEITKGLVSNQIEVNKILMRRVVVSSNTAFPQKVVNIDKVVNRDAINEVGGIIEVQGNDAEDVKKYLIPRNNSINYFIHFNCKQFNNKIF